MKKTNACWATPPISITGSTSDAAPATSSCDKTIRSSQTLTRPWCCTKSGFAPRWYVPRADVVAEALHSVEGQTFCPYKGLASYYDIGDARNAAWSYRAPFEEVARIADLVSFYPEKLAITLDGEKLEPAPGQNVLPHGPDRNLSVDEIGGIQLVEDAMPAEARP
jgi:uncharacterized protein (DUF427 family)